jgi:glycosyltransferase involved in cell wall biosynthesis
LRRPLRVLWLLDSMNAGGAENLAATFARNVDRKRIEPTIAWLASIDGNATAPLLASTGVATHEFAAHSLRDLAAFRRLLAFISDGRFDVIHSHLTYASIWGTIAGRISRVPSVATLHAAPPATGRAARARDRLMRFVLDRWSSCVIAVSASLRTAYLAEGGLRPRKVVVLHNGIEPGRFETGWTSERLHEEFGIPTQTPVVVTVSVQRPGKGIETLIDAAAAVPQAHFLVVGDGPLRAEWEQLSRSRGLAGRMTWTGHRHDVASLLPGCDLFALPTKADAFPTVLLEALAAGLPVVASRVDGVPEIIEDGATGLLVTPGDAGALARAIAALLGDERRRTTMRDAARSTVRGHFSVDSWIAGLESIYRSCA